MKHISSTQLWIGSLDQVKKEVHHIAQRDYCPEKGCSHCVICTQIFEGKHAAQLWLATDKPHYVRTDFDTVFSKIAFSCSDQQPFMCIITQAEKLSIACANTLLKVMEEPPRGWHWILATQRPHEVVATLVSRCLVKKFEADTPLYKSDLYQSLTTKFNGDILFFNQALDGAKLSEYDSRLLCDAVIAYWTKKAYTSPATMPLIDELQGFLSYPAMAGSSKFFWRTVYLTMLSFDL